MSENELEVAYREGRLTKRAYVRQLLDGGDDMAAALARAESIVPAAPVPESTPAPAAAPTGGNPLPTRPTMSEELDINFVGDGYVVHQPSKKRMHSLNHTAALVLELCTGEHDAEAMADLLQKSFDLDSPPRAETEQCLRQLQSEGLIQ